MTITFPDEGCALCSHMHMEGIFIAEAAIENKRKAIAMTLFPF